MTSDSSPFQGDPIDPEEASREEKLDADFLATSEVIDYFAFVDPAKDAIEQGAGQVTLPTAFLSRVIHGLQPLDFPHLRDVYNRLRAERGMPPQRK